MHAERSDDLRHGSCLQEKEMTEAERRWRDERSGGNYGQGTKEMQQRRYIDRREAERKRRELFDDALGKYQAKDIEGVSHGRLVQPLGNDR